MAKKLLDLQYTSEELVELLNRINGRLFVIVVDEKDKCKRIFRTQADADKWFAERDSEDGLSAETAALEFANIDGNGTIPGTQQYELRVNIPSKSYSLTGDTDIYLDFTFATVDKTTEQIVGNSVDVYFTISNGDGVRQKSKVYDYEEGKTYRFKLDEYLAVGKNTVSIMFRDRTLGISRMVTTTHEVINFSIGSNFNIAQPLRQPNDPLVVSYECLGNYRRYVHFYIDGKEVSSETLPATQSGANMIKTFPNFGNTYGLGKHTIQIKASMSLDDDNARVFWTPLLYREFMVAGEDVTTTMVSATFPSTQDPFNGAVPGFTGKQFVKQKLVWAFYSSDKPKANVLWRLLDANGDETTLGSRQADVVEGEAGVLPEPVEFMPTESGDFYLQAVVEGVVIESYKISVAPNEEISMATNGLVVYLSSVGRSNSEDEEFRKDWSSNREGIHAYCDFSEGFPFTAAAGYNNGGVEFYNGHTGIIRGYKPFAPENASVTMNGGAFGMRFRTFNMDDENALVAHIGDPDNNGAGIFIYPNKAILRSSAGAERDIEVRFKDEEDVDLYWVIYPNHDHQMRLFTFMQVGGIRCFPRIYDIAENYNIGSRNSDSDFGLLHIGDPNGKCGIRVYSLHMYSIYQDERQLCNNTIIDSGDIDIQIDRNDIYQMGGGMLDVDVNKLKERMPVIELIGDMAQMEGSEGKPELNNVGFTITHNEYDEHYATCELANIKKAGQSTQDRLGPPSMHVKFNKNKSNILRDRDGKQYPKNRMPILPGYTPENSLRLLNNTLDSSNCHSGGALSFINEIARDTEIDGQHPLRTPAMDFALSKYAEEMVKSHGGKKEDWTFPYKLSFTPHAYAGAVVYKKDADSPVMWLGLYTFIEEKKSFYANGGHSIYDAIDEDGNLDPFCIKTDKKKARLLYDNTGFLRFELVTKSKYSMLQKGGETTFDIDYGEREASMEKISEHDNETEEEFYADWEEYGNQVIKPLCETEGNQAAFDAKIWDIFNIYNVCAYYIWMITVCNTDGSFRNINHARYQTGAKWNLVPWDWDMILGLLQDTYRLDAQPTSDLYTKVDGTYIFNGMGDRIPGATGQDSYWFWDAVLNNAEFKAMLPRVFAAMYKAGMNKTNWFKAFDRFTNTFSPALYNVDALGKFVNPYFNFNKNYLTSDQGDRTAHRHWFLDTNIDFMEQQYGVGDFVNKRTSTRAADADNAVIHAKAGATAFFGWTISGELTDANGNTQEGDVESSSRTPRIAMGEEFTMTVNRKLTSKDILGVLSPHKLEELDMREFARFFSADLQFNSCYNEITKTSLMKKLILGMTEADLRAYGPNERSVNTIDGVNLMSRLEVFSVRGLRGLKSNPDISGCHNLKEYYAGASGLTAFNPPSGAVFSQVELNDSLTSMLATDVTFPEAGVRFVTYEQGAAPKEIDCPKSLLVLNLTGMGDDKGTHILLHRWLMMIKESMETNPEIIASASLNCTGIYWDDATKDDVMMLARLTNRRVTGYIKCNEVYTIEEMAELTEAFGDNVFDYSAQMVTLVCDCNGSGITVSATGKTVAVTEGVATVQQGFPVQFSGAGFPISGSNKKNYRWRIWVDGEWNGGSDSNPVFKVGTVTLNYVTGELTSEENSKSEEVFRVQCYDPSSRQSGEIEVHIIPRTYPTTATISIVDSQQTLDTINGVVQISARGTIVFTVVHTPEGYTGTMRLSSWDIEGFDESLMSKSTKKNDCELSINELPTDDVELSVSFSSFWANKDVNIESNVIKMALVSVIEQLLINDATDGNDWLFKAVVNAGVAHAAPAYFTSKEIKTLSGTFSASTLLGADATKLVKLTNPIEGSADTYFIPRYMKNVNVFDFSGTGITETFLGTATPQATEINLEGTTASIVIGDE